MSLEKLENHSGTAKDETNFDDSDLKDPLHETLHRGLKARQISMIAVRYSHCSPDCSLRNTIAILS